MIDWPALVHPFALGRFVRAEPLTGGHIHRSFRVDCEPGGADREQGGAAASYVFQQINLRVFPRPELVAENAVRVSRHMAAAAAGDGAACGLRPLRFIQTPSGESLVYALDGACWRAMEFVPGGRAIETAATLEQVRAVAAAFGAFQRLLADWSGEPLHETIPGFHDTPARLRALAEAAAADTAGRAGGAAAEIAAILDRRSVAARLMDAHRGGPGESRGATAAGAGAGAGAGPSASPGASAGASARPGASAGASAGPRASAGASAGPGGVPLRVVHNDAKPSNVLLDAAAARVVCVLDLDTVMPGLSLHDFGDLVRSMGSAAAEDEPDVARIAVDPARFAAIAEGYLSQTASMLTATEKSLVFDAALVIVLEQAARFLTDYLQGDRYYAIHRPSHNLDRCRSQLALLASLERQEGELRGVVAGMLEQAC